MSAQPDLFPEAAQPTVADLADFIYRETVFAVLREQIAPESLCTPGAASRTVSAMVRSLRANDAREWLARSGIKPHRRRDRWIPQLQTCVQGTVDQRVQILLGIIEAEA
jgi:hypothetical protein